MIDRIQLLLKKSFVRNVVTVASGTISVQVIAIIFSPIITRLYGPEAFGLLGIFLAIISIISPVSTLTYSTAIVLPEKDKESLELVNVSIVAAGVIFILTSIGIGVYMILAGNHIEKVSIVPYLFLIPIVVFFTSITQIIDQWFIRTQKYKRLASLSVIQAILVNGSKIGIGVYNATATVLISISSIGYLVHSVLFYWKIDSYFKLNIKIFRFQISKNLLMAASKYKDFPLYRAPQMLFSALTKSSPVLLLAYFFGPAAAGFYSIGNRVLNMPTGIVGKSIGSVYYPRIAKAANNKENLKPYIFNATLGMAGLSSIPIIIVILFGPLLFSFVFGNEWITAGHYARWMSFLIFFEFILHPTKDAMIVMGFQKGLLFYEILSFCIKVVMLAIGFYILENDIAAVILFSFGGCLISIVLMGWLFFQSNKIFSK